MLRWAERGYAPRDPLRDRGSEAPVVEALDTLARNSLDGPLLDVNFGREMAYPIAGALADRGVSVVFLSGYNRATLSDRDSARPLVSEPFQTAELLRELVRAVRAPT